MKTEDLIKEYMKTHMKEIKGSARNPVLPMPKPVKPFTQKGKK